MADFESFGIEGVTYLLRGDAQGDGSEVDLKIPEQGEGQASLRSYFSMQGRTKNIPGPLLPPGVSRPSLGVLVYCDVQDC